MVGEELQRGSKKKPFPILKWIFRRKKTCESLGAGLAKSNIDNAVSLATTKLAKRWDDRVKKNEPAPHEWISKGR